MRPRDSTGRDSPVLYTVATDVETQRHASLMYSHCLYSASPNVSSRNNITIINTRPSLLVELCRHTLIRKSLLINFSLFLIIYCENCKIIKHFSI